MQVNLGDTSVDAEFLSALKEKYKILDSFILKNYDQDCNSLREHLQSLRKEVFAPDDRIIITQFDTDYYIDERVGINLINLFNTWKEVDIPLSVMIYYTNSFGVSKEIDHICRYNHPGDRPTVIETFFNPGNYNVSFYPENLDLRVDSIEYHALCMMGSNRSHRFALYNHINHLSDRIALTINALKK